ncbi:MAG: hypothetical protein Q8J69_06900 [Sphingobacteriaceae bacterium]|nr:hypothetical protein [Sphingobacteriaceae bacterium]
MEPEMHMQMGDGFSSGKTTGEFPGMYYVMAQIWKVTGMNYWSYRLFMYFIFAAGAFSFYWSLTKLFKEQWLVLSLAFMLIASPIYLFYGISFLTDAPAFSLVLMGLAAILAYARNQRLLLFYLAMLLFLIAGLIKISSLIAFIFLGGVWVLEILGARTLGDRKLFRKHLGELPGFIAVLGGIYIWYSYAKSYNVTHGFKYTYNDIFPFWLIESDKIWSWFYGIITDNILAYFPYPILLMMLMMWLVNLFSYRRLPLIAWLANVLVISGGGGVLRVMGTALQRPRLLLHCLAHSFPCHCCAFCLADGGVGLVPKATEIGQEIDCGPCRILLYLRHSNVAS